MSDADQLRIAFVNESTFGVAPTGAYATMRVTGESLAQTANYIQSDELDPNRQVTDLIRSNVEAGGNVDFELSFSTTSGALGALFQYAFFASGWSSVVSNNGITISFAASSGGSQVISDSGSGFGSFVVGQWVKIKGASNTANNGVFKISAAAAGSITVNNANGVLEAAGSNVTVDMGAQITNGTTLTTISIEREYQDNTNDFALNVGMGINQVSLNVSPQAIVNGQFQFIGKNETSQSSQTPSGYGAVSTTEVMNAIDHVTGIFEDGSTIDLRDFTWQMNNNLRSRLIIGSIGPNSLGAGKCVVTGTIEGYYEGPTRIDKFLNDTASSLAITFQDSAGNAYVIDMPQVQFTSGTRNATGTNTDVVDPIAFQAYKDPTELITCRMAIFPA